MMKFKWLLAILLLGCMLMALPAPPMPTVEAQGGPQNTQPRGDILIKRGGAYVKAWSGTTAAARGTLLIAAVAALTDGDQLETGPTTFDLGSVTGNSAAGQLDFVHNKVTWISRGSILSHTAGSAKNFIHAGTGTLGSDDGTLGVADDLAIIGPLTIQGLYGTTTGAECGIITEMVERLQLSHITVKDIGGYGFQIASNLPAISANPTRHYGGKITDCHVEKGKLGGFYLMSRAESFIVTSCSARYLNGGTANSHESAGFLVAAANATFVNCISNDNGTGLDVNTGRLVWTGGQIDHTTGPYAIWFGSVATCCDVSCTTIGSANTEASQGLIYYTGTCNNCNIRNSSLYCYFHSSLSGGYCRVENCEEVTTGNVVALSTATVNGDSAPTEAENGRLKWLNVRKADGSLFLGTASQALVSNAINVYQQIHRITGGTLKTLNSGVNGERVRIEQSGASALTIDETGNIQLVTFPDHATSVTFAAAGEGMDFVYNSTLTKWVQATPTSYTTPP